MKVTSYKTKLITGGAVFVLAIGLIAWQGYPRLHQWSSVGAAQVMKGRVELDQLEVERLSFERGKEDLKKLETYVYQPGNLFSTDVALVEELRILERLAEDSNVELKVSASGTITEAVKAKTASELFLVPFRIQVGGTYGEVTQFLERLERVKFVLKSSTISLANTKEGSVDVVMAGNIYLRK